MRHVIKTLYLLFTVFILAGCARQPFAPAKNAKPQTIAFYNTEKFFDTINDPSPADDAFTPQGALQWTADKYIRKVSNIASVIRSIGQANGPELIGLSEIENRRVLQDLVNSQPLRKQKYGIVYEDVPGRQGMQVALLYKPKAFKPTSQRSINLSGEGTGYAASYILQVNGLLQGLPLTVFVTNWPPRTSGKQNNPRQRAAAATLRKAIDALQAADKNTRIVVLGDFDAEPDTEVMQKVLKATGRPNPHYNQELFNTFYVPFVSGMGSYYTRGKFRMTDQVLISKSLLGNQGLVYVRGSALIHSPEKTKFLYGKYKNTPISTFSGKTYFGGYSSHFPVYIQLRKVK